MRGGAPQLPDCEIRARWREGARLWGQCAPTAPVATPSHSLSKRDVLRMHTRGTEGRVSMSCLWELVQPAFE